MEKSDLKIYVYLLIITLFIIPLQYTLSKYIFSLNINNTYQFPNYIEPIVELEESYLLNSEGKATLNISIENKNNYKIYLEILPSSSNISFSTLSTSINANDKLEQEIEFSASAPINGAISVNLLGPYVDSCSYNFKLTTEDTNKMISGNNSLSDPYYLNTSLLKNEIEQISFVGSKNVPNDAIGYFDISCVKGEGTTMLWYYDEDLNDMYELYIGNDTGKVEPKTCENLFCNLANLESINFKDNLGNNCFSTENAVNMSNMFSGANSLSEIDISEFNITDDTNITNMFTNNSTTIYVKDETQKNLIENKLSGFNMIILNSSGSEPEIMESNLMESFSTMFINEGEEVEDEEEIEIENNDIQDSDDVDIQDDEVLNNDDEIDAQENMEKEDIIEEGDSTVESDGNVENSDA